MISSSKMNVEISEIIRFSFQMIEEFFKKLNLNHIDCTVHLSMNRRLMASIQTIINVQQLKKFGVEYFHEINLNSIDDFDYKTKDSLYIFLADKNCDYTELIVKYIQHLIKKKSKNLESKKELNNYFALAYIPRPSQKCLRILNESSLRYHESSSGNYELRPDEIILDSISIRLFPIHSNILSMELPDHFVNGTFNMRNCDLVEISDVLIQLQQLFGYFSRRSFVGAAAVHLNELCTKLKGEIPQFQSVFNHLLVVDRDLDLLSLFKPPSTYGTVIDEHYGICCGRMSLKDEWISSTSGKGTNNSYSLNNDLFFQHIQYLSPNDSLQFVREQMNEIRSLHKKKDEAKKVAELKEFVQNDLKQVNLKQKCTSLHVSIIEDINNFKEFNLKEYEEILTTILQTNFHQFDVHYFFTYITQLMHRQINEYYVIQLIVIVSIVNGFLPNYKELKNSFIQSYGIGGLFLWDRLFELNFINRSSIGDFDKDWKLIDRLGAQMKSTSISEKFSFQQIIRNYFNLNTPNGKTLNNFPIYHFPFIGRCLENVVGDEKRIKKFHTSLKSANIENTLDIITFKDNIVESSKHLILMVVGGITRDEIAMCEEIAKLSKCKLLFIVSNIWTGRKLLKSVKLGKTEYKE
ncbi:hypothetical protein SNEBB_006042 [Seison nebaliae]|nr:hypothetical protein SNEBB_006042 [Seison nebaliae]